MLFFSTEAYTVDNKTNSHFELIITDGTRNTKRERTEPNRIGVGDKKAYRMNEREKNMDENKIVQNW